VESFRFRQPQKFRFFQPAQCRYDDATQATSDLAITSDEGRHPAIRSPPNGHHFRVPCLLEKPGEGFRMIVA
jgi:hypothetical protein